MNPLCKVCAKPIPKQMTHHSFGASEYQMKRGQHEFWRCYPERPSSKEEAQRLVGNRPIVSANGSLDGQGMDSATTWDGESYAWDGHFHAQGCAAVYGTWAASRPELADFAYPAYRDAMAARGATAKEST